MMMNYASCDCRGVWKIISLNDTLTNCHIAGPFPSHPIPIPILWDPTVVWAAPSCIQTASIQATFIFNTKFKSLKDLNPYVEGFLDSKCIMICLQHWFMHQQFEDRTGKKGS